MNKRIRSNKSKGYSEIGAKIELSRMKREGYTNLSIEPFLDYWGNKIKGKFQIVGYTDKSIFIDKTVCHPFEGVHIDPCYCFDKPSK